jgi:segregation and condensation protein B
MVTKMNKVAILEGLLFLSGSEGLNMEDIIAILEVTELEAKALLENLAHDYEQQERGIQLVLLGNRLKLTTKEEHKAYYEKLVEVEQNTELSQAALETLAIIAYNEPITRVKVDEIRGVGCSHLIRKLVSMNLICECGRADSPGRPLCYRTTKAFLDHFGLASIEELPALEDIVVGELIETDLFESKYQEQSTKTEEV